MPTAKSRSRSLLRSFVRTSLATFLVGGVAWVWTDLRQFDPLTAFEAVESLAIWFALGWIPSLGVGGLVGGWEVFLGRHPRARKIYGLVLMVVASVMTIMWVRSMEIPLDTKSISVDTAMYAHSIRKDGEAVEPSGVGEYLDKYYAPRSRYVALRTLKQRRVALRTGGQWSAEDLAVLEQVAEDALKSNHKPLRGLALDTLIWAKLEGVVPGQMADLLRHPDIPPAELSEWLTDWEKPGRPPLEERLSEEDLAVIQDWAAARLPAGLPALRWALEQGGEGAAAAFLARDHSDAALAEVMRSWCTTEGWSPLLNESGPSPDDRAALDAALHRLSKSEDPIFRREAVIHQEWVGRMLRTPGR